MKNNGTSAAIRVMLKGGLGNQLFQLSAAIVASQRTGREFQLDTTLLNLSPILRVLGVSRRTLAIGELVKQSELLSLRQSWRFLTSARRGQIEREVSPLDEVLERVTASTGILVGYFQQLAVVEEAWMELLRRLTSSTHTLTLFEKEKREQIAVHFRAGDYLKTKSHRRHGLTSPNYYLKAVQLASFSTGIKHVRVISDDIEVARSYLSESQLSSKFTVHYESQGNEWSDLGEISNSAAVVMSNSSFSWWGAYLASKAHGSLVVAPKPWFADQTVIETVLFKPNWLIVEREILGFGGTL